MNDENLVKSIAAHEGCKLKAYRDSRDIWTIGYGRNLEQLSISQEQATAWLMEDIDIAEAEAKLMPEFAFLDTDARQNAFVEMVYNMGRPRLSEFRLMLAAIRAQDWQTVYFEALNSSWARQVGRRAIRLAEMLRSGAFPA